MISLIVLIALAALLLAKLLFDTVDFIPFVPPSAHEVATTKSETNLLTAEPLRLMPSLTNVSLMGAPKKSEKPTQDEDDLDDYFVPPTVQATQSTLEGKKPGKRKSVYDSDFTNEFEDCNTSCHGYSKAHIA
ncbi:hypothetical protein COOONC_13023 [Cooperia oncophora]